MSKLNINDFIWTIVKDTLRSVRVRRTYCAAMRMPEHETQGLPENVTVGGH